MIAAIAIGVALGVALAPWLSAGPWALLGLPALGMVRHHGLLVRVLAAMLVIGPAAWWADARTLRPSAQDIHHSAPRRFIRLEGTIATPPQPRPDGWRAEIDLGPRGRVLATWPAAARPWVGDRWAFAGRLSRPVHAENPGAFDAASYLARSGLFATFRAESATRKGCDSRYAGASWLDRLRMRLLDGLSRGLRPDQAALFGSLALGGGAAPVDEDTATDFRRLGLSHLLAASGSQVGLLAGLIYGLARVVRMSPGWAAIATAPWLLGYWLLTGAPPSMTRATVMGLVALVALGLGRRAVPFVALWLTGLVMVLATPGCLFDLGFQFSWLATYGLTRLGRWMETNPLPGPGWAWGMALVPVTAWLWVSPWQLATFHAWSWLALPANWLAGPLIMALTPLGLGLAAIGAIWPQVADLLSPVSRALLGLLQTLVGTLAAQPGLERSAIGWSGWGLAAVYSALWCGLRHPRAAALFACLAAIALAPPRSPRPLELTFLSVGQGDAIVLRTPGDRWVVIDAGPARDHRDAGAAVVLPYIRRHGCNEIALMVATHAHQDHIGGLPALTRALTVRSAWDAGQTEADGCNQALLASWLTRGVPWRQAHPGLRWEADGVRLTAIAPSPGRHTVNDGSVVLRLEYGRFSALLTGDAEGPSERELVASGIPLAATLLKVGHHGSPTSTTPAFLKAVRPRLAVVSVGRHNTFGHPRPSVMRRLRAAGAAIARTDLAGCVRVRSDGHGWAWCTGPDEHTAWHRGDRTGVDGPPRPD